MYKHIIMCVEQTRLLEEWRLLVERASDYLWEAFAARGDPHFEILKMAARIEVLAFCEYGFAPIYIHR